MRKGLWRGILVLALVSAGLALLPGLVGLGSVAIACRVWETPAVNDLGSRDSSPEIQQVVQNIPDYHRPEDATYFTLPEWYVVYSTDEYAAFIQDHPPSQFPYFRAVYQFWESWVDACGAARGRYPFNSDYQFSLLIVGLNFTGETLLRGLYETTAGRVTELLSTRQLSEEDAYARQVAKEYGEFIHMVPWYDFPFPEKLRGLWTGTSLWGANPLRKWERKLVLSLEYAVKAFYAGIIRRGAQSVYGGPDETRIYSVVEGVSDAMLAGEPGLHRIQPVNTTQELVTLTRFEAFTQMAPGLARQGLRFIELAGNDEILVTVNAPASQAYSYAHATYLFAAPILTQPGRMRVALKVHVPDLHLFLQALETTQARLEHIYDY